MTEDEAGKKLCCGPRALIATLFQEPLAKVPDDARREALIRDVSMCIGTRCMAWRWTGASHDTPLSDGHCGLAGKP